MKYRLKRFMALVLVIITLCLTACNNPAVSMGTDEYSNVPPLETPSTEEPIGKLTNAPTQMPSDDTGDTSTVTSTPEDKNEKDPAIAISELMVNNVFTAPDAEGNYRPWFEVQNISGGKVSLGEYTLTINDISIALPTKELAIGEYLLVFADLPAEGTLLIMHGEKITQKFAYSNPSQNHSFLVKEGAETTTPTPGYENVLEGVTITISELLCQNTIHPVNGKLGSYIELYNPGDKPLELSDFFISAYQDDRYQNRLPAGTLGAGEYKLFMTEDLGMMLSSFASSLYITRKDGVLCGSVSYPDLTKNDSYTPEGYTIPTPGYQNNDDGRNAYLAARTGLIISEVISANNKYYKIDGEYYDLVELQNIGNETVELSDYYLSDSAKDHMKYQLPAGTVKPGGYAVIPLSGRGGDESPFKLSLDGENLLVTRKDDYMTDALTVPYIPANRSWGRSNGELVYFLTPTFGKENGTGETKLSPKPTASLVPGFYKGEQQVTFSYEGTVYYTTDNSKPTTYSKVYKGETITLKENTAVRMICQVGERIPSDEVCFNYFIDSYELELPVMKLTVNHDEMYGENGIYTLNYYQNGNFYFNRDEIETTIAYYIGGEQIFGFNCGLKVFGANSRILPKKSYQLKFRAIYGMSKLKYDIFEDGEVTEFNSLVLRSGAQDYNESVFRDEFTTSLVASYVGDEVITQKYRAINLYINEQYIGVYFIREKIDDNFVASRLNVSPESVEIVATMRYVEEGDGTNFNEFFDYLKTHDLSKDEHYQYIAERMSIESAIEYYIAISWSDNRDIGNVRMYRSTEGDGKWRFILYDCDLTYGKDSKTSVQYSQKVSAAHVLLGMNLRAGTIITALMKNATFRDLYFTRLNERINNELSSANATAYLQSMKDMIDHDMQYDVYATYKSWATGRYGVKYIVNYLSTRDTTFVNDYIKECKLTDEEVEKYFGKFEG